MLEYADFVSEESADLTTATVVTLNSSAASGNRTFAQAVTDADLSSSCDVIVTLIQASATATWRATYANTGGTLTRISELQATGTLSTGAGNTGVFITVDAATLQGAVLPISAATVTSGDTAGAVGRMDVLSISGATAGISWTLPSSPAVGDRAGVTLSTDAHATVGRELFIHAAASTDSIDGATGYHSAGTEFTRLLMAGESLIFRCVDSTTPGWVLESGRRKKTVSLMHLTTAPGTGTSAFTWYEPTSLSGLWTQAENEGGIGNASAGRVVVRRDGCYTIAVKSAPTGSGSTSWSDVGVEVNGTAPSTGYPAYMARTDSVTGHPVFTVCAQLSAGDVLDYQYRSDQAGFGLTAAGFSTFHVVEEL